MATERRPRTELAEQRLAAGFSQESLARKLGVSVASVRGWETGTRTPVPTSRQPLAEALGVSPNHLHHLLSPGAPIELDGLRVPHWLNTYESLVLEAGRLAIVVRSAIHAMLQTRAYATGVERNDDTSTDAEIAERVEVRLARQSVLEREPTPLGLVAVLHEGVLRDVVGGPNVMAEQLDHLVAIAERPNVELRVLPADGRATYCPGEFELLVKQGEVEPFMGITIDPGGADYHERDVREFAAMFARVRSVALPPDQTTRRIEEIRETYR